MKKLKKIAAAVLTAALAAGTINAFAFENAININLIGISDYSSHYVEFSGVRPTQVNGYTYVPVRQLAESAGMTVSWDAAAQTAIVSLTANAGGSPVQQYAASVISTIGGYGLELSPRDISLELRLNNTSATVRYNFTDTDGDTVAIGKNTALDSAAILIDGTLMIPLRNSMELFGLNVGWDQATLTASISIPDYVSAPKGLSIVANYTPGAASAPDYNAIPVPEPITVPTVPEVTSVTVAANDPVDTNPALGQYLGRFKITYYCPCAECNGGWGNNTAWAGAIVPGQTVAVDPSIIGKLRWIYIDGIGVRRAEDVGGAVQGYHIDVAVANHADPSLEVSYRDVYYLAE